VSRTNPHPASVLGTASERAAPRTAQRAAPNQVNQPGTKHQLAERLFASQSGLVRSGLVRDYYRHWYDSQGLYHCGLLLVLQREDGSGSSFNVTIQAEQGGYETFHLRTVD
jgi:hypothetical protein